MKAGIVLIVLCGLIGCIVAENEADSNESTSVEQQPLAETSRHYDVNNYHLNGDKYRDSAPQTMYVPAIEVDNIIPRAYPHPEHSHENINVELHFQGDNVHYIKKRSRTDLMEKAVEDLKSKTDALSVNFYEGLLKLAYPAIKYDHL